MALTLHGENGLDVGVAPVRAPQLGRLLDHRQGGVEALVAQDGRDVLLAGHGIAHLGAGQPVDRAGGGNRVDGLPALQPDRVEVGQVQVRDQLWHEPPQSVRPAVCVAATRPRLVEPAPGRGSRSNR